MWARLVTNLDVLVARITRRVTLQQGSRRLSRALPPLLMSPLPRPSLHLAGLRTRSFYRRRTLRHVPATQTNTPGTPGLMENTRVTRMHTFSRRACLRFCQVAYCPHTTSLLPLLAPPPSLRKAPNSAPLKQRRSSCLCRRLTILPLITLRDPQVTRLKASVSQGYRPWACQSPQLGLHHPARMRTATVSMHRRVTDPVSTPSPASESQVCPRRLDCQPASYLRTFPSLLVPMVPTVRTLSNLAVLIKDRFGQVRAAQESTWA